jgi:hypothetical protein
MHGDTIGSVYVCNKDEYNKEVHDADGYGCAISVLSMQVLA